MRENRGHDTEDDGRDYPQVQSIEAVALLPSATAEAEGMSTVGGIAPRTSVFARACVTMCHHSRFAETRYENYSKPINSEI